MDKKDGILFIAGGSFEFIGWGFGMITHIPEQVGYCVVAIGFIVLVIAIIRFIRYKPIYPTWQEIQARGEAKRWYLDPFKENITAITTRYQTLLNKAIENNVKYFDSISAKGVMSAATKIGKYLLNNPYYTELKNSSAMDELRNKWSEPLRLDTLG